MGLFCQRWWSSIARPYIDRHAPCALLNKGIEQNATSYTGEERRMRVSSYLTRSTEA